MVYILCTYDLLVNVVLGRLYLRHVLRVPDEPQDLVTGKRQSHEDKQGLGGLVGTQSREEEPEMLGETLSYHRQKS